MLVFEYSKMYARTLDDEEVIEIKSNLTFVVSCNYRNIQHVKQMIYAAVNYISDNY